jgi:hypothetical protein
MRTLGVVLACLVGMVACGGSSEQVLGGPDTGDGGASDGSSGGASSSSSSSGGSSSGGTDGGGTKDGNGGQDAPGSQQCGNGGATFSIPPVQTGCTSSDACVFELHEVTCCGPRQAYGVNHAYATSFQSAEAAWEATCPKCGCPTTNQVTAQDGKTGEIGQLQVKCDTSGGGTGKCTTFFN